METVKEENEKKKEYLKQYGKALRQEKRIEEELERLKLDRMLPGALAADAAGTAGNAPAGTSGTHAATGPGRPPADAPGYAGFPWGALGWTPGAPALKRFKWPLLAAGEGQSG